MQETHFLANMSFANIMTKIASQFNSGFRIFKLNVRFKSTCNTAALDSLKFNNVSQLMLPPSFSLHKNKTEKFCFTFPHADIAIKKSIIEPGKSIKINFELPIKSSTNPFMDLPLYIEKEIKEPSNKNTISKRATHLTIIRRRKMKKHKLKKLLKKFKIQIAEKELKKQIKMENEFQLSLKDILSKGENFSPEKYVNETLEKVHWKRPLTRVRGFLAPKWVVDQYLESKKEKKIIQERINECLK